MPAEPELGSSVRRPRRRSRAAAEHEGRGRKLEALARRYTLEAALAAVALGSVLAIGSVHPPSILALAIAGGGLLLASRRRSALPTPTWVLLGLAAYSVLQALPLPVALLQLVAPHNAEVWAHALDPLALPAPKFASLSIDPGASLIEALKWFTYAGVFAAAAQVAMRRGIAWCAWIVFGGGALVVLISFLHWLAGAERVYGLYLPQAALHRHVGPLLNPNNLAGYANLAALCGVGLLATRDARWPRWVPAVGVTLLIAGTIRSASKAGAAALALGLTLYVVALWVARRGEQRGVRSATRRALLGLALALIGGFGIALASDRAQIWSELTEDTSGKLAMWSWTGSMIADHPWFGVGRGAFETAFGPYRVSPLSGNVVITHPENFVTQWLSEWGLPVSIAGFTALAWTLRPYRLGIARRAVWIACATAIGALLLQNLVDLALEVAGVAVAVAIVLGGMWGEGRPLAAGVQRTPRLTLWAASAGGAAVWAGAALFGAQPIERERPTLWARYLELSPKDRAAVADLRRSIQHAIGRHPGDAYLPLLGGLLAYRVGDQDPMPWVERALERDLFNSRAHYLLAHVLRRRGALNQALLELRLAGERDTTMRLLAGDTAGRWVSSLEQLMRAVPSGDVGAGTLEGACPHLRNGRERIDCFETAVQRMPRAALYRRFAAGEILRELEAADAGACAGGRRARCLERLAVHTRQLQILQPDSSLGAELAARGLLLEGKPAAAEQLLARECGARLLSLECLRLRVRDAARSTPPTNLDVAIEALRNASCTTDADCASTWEWVGDVVAETGNWAAAALYQSRAARQQPTAARWRKVQAAAAQAGLGELARDAAVEAERSATPARTP